MIVLLPDYRTVSTARIGSEWVYSIDNNRAVFTVLALNDGGATHRYVGPQYVPIPKEVKMGTFTETFGSVSNCIRGQLKTGEGSRRNTSIAYSELMVPIGT